MTCDDVRTRLTAYLDGDLDPDRGTVVRGHLRACAACRQVATQEAALRDGLRALPTLDPPPALWANIQQQLAAAEVEDAKLPAWKRRVRAARAWLAPSLPRFAIGGLLAAAAVAVLWWRTHDRGEPAVEPVAERPTRVVQAPSPELKAAAPTPSPAAACNLEGSPTADVTDDLRAEAARVTACYAQTASELLALANEASATWTADQRAAFDAEVRALRAAVDAADEGRPRQRAWRALNRYVQTALTRDRIVLAGVTP